LDAAAQDVIDESRFATRVIADQQDKG
jgi:hypothetical protein